MVQNKFVKGFCKGRLLCNYTCYYDLTRDVNGILKNSLKMPESRGRIGPGGVKGQRPYGGHKGATPPGRN